MKLGLILSKRGFLFSKFKRSIYPSCLLNLNLCSANLDLIVLKFKIILIRSVQNLFRLLSEQEYLIILKLIIISKDFILLSLIKYIFGESNTKIKKSGQISIFENVFYCQNKIKLSSHKIIGSRGFLSAFINKNHTLNKHFNSLVLKKYLKPNWWRKSESC